MDAFLDENQFRDWVQAQLQAKLEAAADSYMVMRSKNVNDIIVCKGTDTPLALFIEVKYAKGRSGRIGIGDGEGGGFQPEVLTRRPVYFERFVRWLIASEAGIAVLIDSETARRHAVGGTFAIGKQKVIGCLPHPRLLRSTGL